MVMCAVIEHSLAAIGGDEPVHSAALPRTASPTPLRLTQPIEIAPFVRFFVRMFHGMFHSTPSTYKAAECMQACGVWRGTAWVRSQEGFDEKSPLYVREL